MYRFHGELVCLPKLDFLWLPIQNTLAYYEICAFVKIAGP